MLILLIRNGLYGSGSVAEKRIVLSKADSQKRSSITICSICKQEVGKGLTHPSSCSIASSSTNISNQVLRLPSKQQDQLVSNVLNEKASHELGKGGSTRT